MAVCEEIPESDDILKTVLASYMNNDEDVILVGSSGFTVYLKHRFISCFIPVMKTALETSLKSEEEKSEKRKKIVLNEEFDKDTAECFVKILQERKAIPQDWSQLVKLIKFCHYYQCMELFESCCNFAKGLIKEGESFFSAIPLIDLYEIKNWNEPMKSVFFKERELILKDSKWDLCLQKHPKAMAYIQSDFWKTNEKNSTNVVLASVKSCIANTTCFCYCKHTPKHFQTLKDLLMNSPEL